MNLFLTSPRNQRRLDNDFPPEEVRCALSSTEVSTVLLSVSPARDKSSEAYLA